MILPPDFAFSAGWDAPPAGALFHLEDDLNGLILAPVGSAPPSEFPEWSLDFFLPAAIPTLDSGFNALTFTGVSGTRVEEFVASFGGAVTAVFRFNSATQQYETFTLGAPAFVNTLTTLQQGDALLLAVDRTAPFSQIDLLPASGMRRIALRTGSNLVSYTGASGPIDDILGEVPGLVAAFVHDSVTQQWLAYRPDGPAFLTQVAELDRLQPVFLIMTESSAWTYEVAGSAAGAPAAE